MAAFLLLAFLLSMISYSSASYCVCNQGVNNTALQRNIDYACGAGADCSAIIQTGSCYQPNTVKAHCDYAVNNYYQKKNQVTGSCDFSGTASVTSTLTSTVVSGCTYPASPSGVSSSTPTSSASTPTSSSTSSTTSPTSTTGTTTTFPITPTPTSSFSSRGCTIHVDSISVTLKTLFLIGFLSLWC